MKFPAWFKRKKKPEINHDYLTRLDCRELAELQDATRNAVIGLRMELKIALHAIATLSRAYMKMDEFLKRIEMALAKKES